MRIAALIALLTLSGAAVVNAQTPAKPPVIFAPPVTPDEPKAPPPAPVTTTTVTLPLHPVSINARITEVLVPLKGKPLELPALPAAGPARDDWKAVKLALIRAKMRFTENTVAEADAPDGGVGSSSSTDMTPMGFVTFPDGHQGFNPAAIDQTTALSLTPTVQKDKTLHVALTLKFTEVTHPPAPVKKPAKPDANPPAPSQAVTRDFHPPVATSVIARPGDTLLLGQPEIGKTTERLLFVTLTILPPEK